jgi:Tfp pilus assembly protein PilP
MEFRCKRRWFQFRLQTVFAAMTIAAVQCAVCLPALRDWNNQREEEVKNTNSQSIKLQSFQCFPYTAPRRPHSTASTTTRKSDLRGVAPAKSN